MRPAYIRKQTSAIARSTSLFKGFLILLPSRRILSVFNALIIYLKLFKYVVRGKEILIFSRDLIGREIEFLKRITKCRIIFYFDARAASAEEKKYISIKHKNYTRSRFLTIANIYYLEYITSFTAKKIFSVSNVLKDYYINTFTVDSNKFVYYPCLSDAGKFFYDTETRRKIREELHIQENTLVFVYSGGIRNEWHIGGRLFSFAYEAIKKRGDMLFLILTKDLDIVKEAIQIYDDLNNKTIALSVPNNEVYKYLNASDFGLLFRENTIMNNVASPTKFAEYMLCGLPVVISEGVGDYSRYAVENNVGVLIGEEELEDPSKYDFNKVFAKDFLREKIAESGIRQFSKQSIIDYLIEQFNE